MIDLPIRHILFPYDFSKQGSLTARYVTAFAKRFDARVTVLSVGPPGYTGKRSTDWKRALKCRLDRALVGEFADVKVELEADCGDAALRIKRSRTTTTSIW
jgi:nucleotide-binding universal stress UspA family protein